MTRALSPNDLNPKQDVRGAFAPSIFLRNLVINNTDATLNGNDTFPDSEPSIAVNPENPNEIVVLAFSGGWRNNGATAAPLWHSLDGGNTWSKLRTIPSPGAVGTTNTCPCDQAPDFGRNRLLCITFLSATFNPTDNLNIYTGCTDDPTDVTAWQWANDGMNPGEAINEVGTSVDNADQPWLLVNVDPNSPLQDRVYNAYDNFGVNPRGMQMSDATGAVFPDFTGADQNVGFANSGVNPGHRMAKDPRTGFMYSAFQNNLAGGADPKNIDYMLSRSTDGGGSWSAPMIVANGDSTQPTPKFGTVNALLGGVLHLSVDPNLGHVYYAYGDRDGSGFNRISLARLQDDGSGNLNVAMTSDVTGQVQAAIPSVAVASDGTVGVFYYTFDGFSSDSFPIFTAWLALSRDQGATFERRQILTFLSASQDDSDPRQRVLGDYVQMKTVGRTFFGTFTANGAVSGRPYADHDPYFFKETVGPIITIEGQTEFSGLCAGDLDTEKLEISNTGPDNLVLHSVSKISGDDDITLLTSPGAPVTIFPGAEVGFDVQCAPASPGVKTAIIRIDSNDPDQPIIDLEYTCTSGDPEINVSLVDEGSFGEVCRGDLADLNLQILNEGTCALNVSSISLSDTANFELPAETDIPFDLQSGSSIDIPIRFAPGTELTCSDTTPIEGTVTVASDDADEPSVLLDVSGIVPCPDLNVAIANSGDFGNVCLGDHSDLNLTLFNQGRCDLTIESIAIDNPNFVLPDDTMFPLVLSHDADFNLPVRFDPADDEMCSDTPETGTITINSDSPGEEMLEIDVSGTIPCPELVIDPTALSGLYAFPATVVDVGAALGCFSERDVTIRNAGACPLTIDDIQAAGADFSVTAPTQFPVLLPSGEETLLATVRFHPQSDADPLSPSEVVGQLTITSDDPDGAVMADLCGESAAQSGVRFLVTDVTTGTPVPVAGVDRITLTSKGKNTPSPVNITLNDAPILNANVCGNPILYHLDAEILAAAGTTGNNPNSSYQATAKEGNLQDSRSINLQQCEFSEFQLQLTGNSGGEPPPACVLGQKGDSCTMDSECCSNRCAGQPGNMTCK